MKRGMRIKVYCRKQKVAGCGQVERCAHVCWRVGRGWLPRAVTEPQLAQEFLELGIYLSGNISCFLELFQETMFLGTADCFNLRYACQYALRPLLSQGVDSLY